MEYICLHHPIMLKLEPVPASTGHCNTFIAILVYVYCILDLGQYGSHVCHIPHYNQKVCFVLSYLAQVHTHCYNKFRSKAESCNPCADEALKYQPWTYGQLLSCMPSKLRMVVLLARVFCSVSHCVTGSQFGGGGLGSFGSMYLTRKPAISFEQKIRHLRMTYSFRTFITMFQAT